YVPSLEVDAGLVASRGRLREVERVRLDVVDVDADLAREIDAVRVAAAGSRARLQHGARGGEQVARAVLGDALVLGPAVGSTGRLELARQEDVSRARVRDLEVRARFLAGKDEQAPRPGAVARLGAFRVVDQHLAGDDELQRAGAVEVAGRAARPGRLGDDENRPFGHVAALEVDDGVVLDVGRPR